MRAINATTLTVPEQRAVVDWLGERNYIPDDATIFVCGRLALYQVYSDVSGPVADAHIQRWGTLPRRWRLRWVRSPRTRTAA